MTNDAFFAALTACKDQFIWTVEDIGQIRGTGHPQYPGVEVCPWTALAMTQGQLIPISEYRRAAKLLRVPEKKADRLATVADWGYSTRDYHAAALRKRLLDCLELKEVNDDEEIDDE